MVPAVLQLQHRDYLVIAHFTRFLESEGIAHEYHESAGNHDMVFWHEYIAKIVEWMFG